MKTRSFIFLFVLVGASVSMYYIFLGNESTQSYIDEILRERKEKDGFMRSSDDSPFGDKRVSFKALNYFPPDLKYRIHANLNHVPKKEVMNLATNNGEARSYLTYGWAEFDLDNLHHKLLILEVMEPGPDRGTLFLAFADQTSAHETYGAGRYLDITKTPGANTITLDFNQAYNPYCAYSENFTCPFPPKENILKTAIKAGEQNYK